MGLRPKNSRFGIPDSTRRRESPRLRSRYRGRCSGYWSLSARLPPRPKALRAIPAMCSPIASEAVAPGEGAFSTWTAFEDATIRKSSTRDPVRSTAWARTPAAPRARSCSRKSGTSFWSACVKALLLSDRRNSRAPVLQCREAILQNPGYPARPARSDGLIRPIE